MFRLSIQEVGEMALSLPVEGISPLYGWSLPDLHKICAKLACGLSTTEEENEAIYALCSRETKRIRVIPKSF